MTRRIVLIVLPVIFMTLFYSCDDHDIDGDGDGFVVACLWCLPNQPASQVALTH